MSETERTDVNNRPSRAPGAAPAAAQGEVILVVTSPIVAGAGAGAKETPGPAAVAMSSVPTMVGFRWEGLDAAREAAGRVSTVDAEFDVPQPPPAAERPGEAPRPAPGTDAGGERAEPPPNWVRAGAASGAGALARIEPQFTYTSPPPPSWLRVHHPERVGEPSPQLVMLADPHSTAAQQFRTLRYRLEREADAQLIAVTSPRAAEGKSVTAANLALALAEGGRQKVLLIDAALQMPAQDRLFGVSSAAIGLTAVLAAIESSGFAAVDTVAVSRNLLLLPTGPAVRSAHAALASEAAAQLVGLLRRTFRYIIVDASSVLGTAETLAWHGMIDRYVMVARRGRTTLEDLGKAADRLGRDKILGVSFVGADPRTLER